MFNWKNKGGNFQDLDLKIGEIFITEKSEKLPPETLRRQSQFYSSGGGGPQDMNYKRGKNGDASERGECIVTTGNQSKCTN